MKEEPCADCNKITCPYCGKEFKTKSGLIMHMKTCEKQNNREIILEDPTIPIVEPLVTIEPDMNDEIRGFFLGLGSRPLRGRHDIETLFRFFKWMNPQSTLQMDWRCSSCVSQIYRRVEEYHQKIKS